MALGWGQFFGGLGRVIDKIPIQGRKERWLNEIDNLNKEKEEIKKGKCNVKKALRLDAIDKRLDYLNQLLRNATQD